MLRIYLLIAFILGIVLNGSAQELKPHGYFHIDSAQLGEIVPYTLTFEYPRNFKVIFPDSTYDYSPFELESKTTYPTSSDSIRSKDSVTYYLSSFEIDPVLNLSLPVFLVSGGDSTGIYAGKDSIIFKEMIAVMPDSIALEENTQLVEVSKQFNYPYLLIALGLLLLIVLIGILTMGKIVRKKFQLFRLRKKHEKFIAEFDKQVIELEIIKDKELTEHLLLFWKSYMEKVNKLPFKKLTTKEIALMTKDEGIQNALREIDKSIYGTHFDENVLETVPKLKYFATNAYDEAVTKIKDD